MIGLVCGHFAAGAGLRPWQGVPETYITAVLDHGGIPVLVPLGLKPEKEATVLAALDGLLLVGGGDVDPVFYGESRREWCGTPDRERDRSEMALIRGAIAQDLPFLAICRGIQVLNVALGGSLYQDIAREYPGSPLRHRTEERQAPAHPVDIEPGSRLAGIVGEPQVAVNSLHHQALKDVAPGLAVTARAPDGLVEVVEVEGCRFGLGVQWHPEELVAAQGHARALFHCLMEEADSPGGGTE